MSYNYEDVFKYSSKFLTLAVHYILGTTKIFTETGKNTNSIMGMAGIRNCTKLTSLTQISYSRIQLTA